MADGAPSRSRTWACDSPTTLIGASGAGAGAGAGSGAASTGFFACTPDVAALAGGGVDRRVCWLGGVVWGGAEDGVRELHPEAQNNATAAENAMVRAQATL